VREMRTQRKRDQNIPWDEESVVTTSTKSNYRSAGLFPKSNIDSYLSLAPWHMI
jgi:hypothetical protein